MRELGMRKKQSFYESFMGRILPAISQTNSVCMTDNYIPVEVSEPELLAGLSLKVKIDAVAGEKAGGCVVSFF